jgi:hypothetical protein
MSSMAKLVIQKLQVLRVRKAARPNPVARLTSVKVPTNGDSVSERLQLFLHKVRKKRLPVA